MAQVPEKVGFLGGDVRNDEERRTAHFLWSMTKDPSKYEWKSEKQAMYYLNLYKKSEGEGDMWSKEPPKGTEMVFWVELHIGGIGGVDFGRKWRRRARILYMNRNGLLRFDEVKFYYDDKGGGGGVDNIIQGKPTGISSETPELPPEKIPQWKKDKETIKAQSQHVGQPKERMQKELTLLNSSGPYDSQVSFNRYSYASYYINIYKDDENNMYVHFGDPIGITTSDEEGRTSYEPLEKGQKALIKFTVKKHTERDGTKQTIIIRPKIVKKLSEKTMPKINEEKKKPIFERYSKKLNESKRSEQISRSLGYLLSIAGDAKTLQAGIEAAEPMLNKKLVKRLAATLHVISKIKTGKTPNEAPISGEDATIKGGEDKKDDKKKVNESNMNVLANEIDNILASVNLAPEEAIDYVVKQLKSNPTYMNVPNLESIVSDYITNKVTKARQDSI